MAISSDKQRADSQKTLVGFVVGAVAYAVPIDAVREVVNPLELTALPHAAPAVAGVADHRGEVVPIVDLRRRFGLAERSELGRSKWILVDVGGRTVGLAVDAVTEVFGTSGEGLRPPPSLGAGDERRGIIGVTTHDERLTFVLDVARFESLVAPLDEAGLLRAVAVGD
ncbi:MAG: chemotaxis protein CheW [Sorangiineae bacterium]|nr:chemotaxis protein CheW [Polyangiaceae bacterium]MEB2321425.1 chemotaxis protein CheW [Sorangiineae bacterium]